MASEFSFDVVSEIDRQELTNALDQARREITARYDFKDVVVEIKLEPNHLIISAPSEFKFNAVMDIVKSKLMRRQLDLRILGEAKIEPASGGTVRANVPLAEGIAADTAKKISKIIRDNFPKVKPTIQGEAIRVNSKSKNELQAVMTLLKHQDELVLPLQFTNYR
ncbi:MAG: YajQ family cyclic di-GMP-binding protein [Patescibacteria group bacterium]